MRTAVFLYCVKKIKCLLLPSAFLAGEQIQNNQIIMNQYETVFILTPVLSEQQMKEAVKDYEKFIKTEGAKMVSKEDWGLRKLAYPIQKKSNGFYTLFEFQAEPSFVANLELKFKRDERVIRFLTVKMDKFHVEYAEKRRNKKKEVKA